MREIEELSAKVNVLAKQVEQWQVAMKAATDALLLHASALQSHQEVIDILLTEQKRQQPLASNILN